MLFIAAVGLVFWILPKNTSCTVTDSIFSIGLDWKCGFRPAVLNLFHGQTPYQGAFFNPPWTLLLLAPLGMLPPDLGASVIFVLSITSYLYAAARLGMSRWSMVFFLFNPYVFIVARQGNLDWMVALGAVLPPQIGLFLVLVKPQTGIAIALFWLVDTFRQGGIRKTLQVFAPVTTAYLLSFIPFGLWIFPPGWLITHPMNYSLWPLSIPVGLALLAAAIRGRDIRRAVSASPFLSPYVLTMSWSIAFLGLNEWEQAAAWVGLMIMHLLVPGLGQYPIHLMP